MRHIQGTLDVVVVGGGPAGTTAALRAAELGARVTLVERERLGGTCTNDGCAPTRVLARAARLARDAALFEVHGLTAQAPTVDLGRLLRHTQETITDLHAKKQLIANLERAGVRVLSGAGATFVDAHTLRLVDDQRLQADRFILCAGGHGRPLPVPGGELALTHRDVWSLKTLPPRLAVIGAAATGCQLASIFAAFGSRVQLLELAPRILPGEDADVSHAIASAFAARGVDVHCGVRRIERFERVADGVRVAFDDGQGARSLTVDAVIAATGWTGNLEALGLDAAGVACARGYVAVNDRMQTSQPHIFAAGDLTGRVMLVQTAQIDARIAAEQAVLGHSLSAPAGLVPHGGFTDPDYAGVGLTEAQALAAAPDDVLVAIVPYTEIDRAVIDRRSEGFCKLIVSRATGAVLGAHVVGEQAVEIVHSAAVAMAGGLSVAQLADVAFAYPTYTAAVGQAARRALRQLTPSVAPGWRELAAVG